MDFAAQEEGHEIGIAERMCILPMRIRERLDVTRIRGTYWLHDE